MGGETLGRILGLLDQKIAGLSQILDGTERVCAGLSSSSALAQDSDLFKALSSLEKGRRALIRQLEAMEGELARLLGEWRTQPSQRFVLENEKIEERRVLANSMLRRILELDGRIKGALRLASQEVRSRLTLVQQGRRTLSSYRSPVPASPRFCDQRA